MARPFGYYSSSLLGRDGFASCAACLRSARALHALRLADPDVQLSARPDARQEFLDGQSPGLADLVSESPQAARYSSQESGRQWLHGCQLWHRLLLFRPLLWDHGQASSSLQLVRLQGGHRTLWAGRSGASFLTKLQQVPLSKNGPPVG